ncbi:hypothetical protein H6P81_005512 [Aristolochia fimbriata]|uniref:Uncharacterized protein n=1 Tax=Aristolochia fimbriata TaxID=158543 RepID=A0AAV7EV63_ARIFI|nr:hypothetical protein H6P81_005512 [Aristolochia fimbriata]
MKKGKEFQSRKPVFCQTAFRTRRRSLPLSVLPTPSKTENVVLCDLATISWGGSISSSVSSSSSSSSTNLCLDLVKCRGHAGTFTGADCKYLAEAAGEPARSSEMEPERGIATGRMVRAAVAAERVGSREGFLWTRARRSPDSAAVRPNLSGRKGWREPGEEEAVEKPDAGGEEEASEGGDDGPDQTMSLSSNSMGSGSRSRERSEPREGIVDMSERRRTGIDRRREIEEADWARERFRNCIICFSWPPFCPGAAVSERRKATHIAISRKRSTSTAQAGGREGGAL